MWSTSYTSQRSWFCEHARVGFRAEVPGARVLLMSAERFMFDFVQALRNRDTHSFKTRLRSADLLLVDDLQFIAGKDSTQEEFFHTINEVMGAGKRLVTGESLFTTVFTHRGRGKARVAFASPTPGSILPIRLADVGGTLICQKDSFLAAAKGVSVWTEDQFVTALGDDRGSDSGRAAARTMEADATTAAGQAAGSGSGDTRAALASLPRKELQARAKAAGLKANAKSIVLIEQLAVLAKGGAT